MYCKLLNEFSFIDENSVIVQELSYLNNKLYLIREDLLPLSFGGSKLRIVESHIENMKKNNSTAMIV